VRRRERGFVFAILVLSMVALIACVGLAVDTGYLQLIKSRMQTAADAAAIGGAEEVRVNGPANVVAAADNDAGLNGFTNGQNSVSITVNNPPQSGSYTSDSAAVEVLVSQSVNPLFMGVLGFGSVTVAVRSVARTGSGPNCLYTLDPSASAAFSISNGATLSMACGVMVNSTSATAFKASGGSETTATSIDVVGNYSITNGASVSPTPVAGVAAVNNPLSYLTPPTVGACQYTNESIGSDTVITLPQAVYCGGITIGNGANVTFSGGTYIIKGGGLNFGGGATISGSGVTFYLTSGTGYSYGPVSIGNGVTVTLSAPTTGSYAGVLFYQDPTIASPAASTFEGGSKTVLNGALYFPTSALSYANGAASQYTILVADTISFSGGTTVNANYSSLPYGSPIRGYAVLSE
jgi:hypothetical protein